MDFIIFLRFSKIIYSIYLAFYSPDFSIDRIILMSFRFELEILVYLLILVYIIFISLLVNTQWRCQRKHRERPPPKLKKCCRKMMLFQRALFLTTFPKIDKNSMFLMNFYQKISKFSQNSPKICIFRRNARKINAAFLKFCCEWAKIMHFCYFLKKFLKIFSKIPQRIMFFVKTRENLTHGFEIFFENGPK